MRVALPHKLHTYLLTLGMRGSNLETNLKVTVGNPELQGSSLAVNRSAGEVRVLFTYDAGSPNAFPRIRMYDRRWD